MITYEEAYQLITRNVNTLGVETVGFENTLNRVLAEDVRSDMDMPPFNKSAMDGYACRMTDIHNPLEVVEEIPAGKWPQKEIGKNQCAKIMTGAPIPKGADTVIMVEHTKQADNGLIEFTNDNTKSNICYLGEDVKEGDILLTEGTIIKEKHIPVLAMVGATKVKVYKQARVAIVSTGNELVEPHVKPELSQIRNSNAYQMMAQTHSLGLPVHYLGIAADTKDDTTRMLHKALEQADVVIMSGAVSMGDYDFVPDVLKEAGFHIHFHGVSTKPGKKTIFGTKGYKWFVGVPGNPVSAFVQFKMLIKPLLLGIMGHHYQPQFYKLPLAVNFNRRNAKRKAFEPVIITEAGSVKPVEYHGSAHINSLAYADGLMVIEIGVKTLKKGEKVDVRPI